MRVYYQRKPPGSQLKPTYTDCRNAYMLVDPTLACYRRRASRNGEPRPIPREGRGSHASHAGPHRSSGHSIALHGWNVERGFCVGSRSETEVEQAVRLCHPRSVWRRSSSCGARSRPTGVTPRRRPAPHRGASHPRRPAASDRRQPRRPVRRGGCDDSCGCMTGTPESDAAGASASVTGCGCAPDDTPQPVALVAPGGHRSDPPIACSLSRTDVQSRTSDWQALLTTVERRETLTNGVCLGFGHPAPLTQISRLAAAEYDCCPSSPSPSRSTPEASRSR